MCPIASSATDIVLPVGALTTGILRLEAAATSILSTPTPARPITLRFAPFSMTFAVTFVLPRTMSASYFSMFLRRSSGLNSMTST